MAASFTHITQATHGSGTDASIYSSFSAFTPTAGNYLVAFVAASGTVLSSPTLTDSLGGTYTLVHHCIDHSDNDSLYLFVKDTAAVASSQTLTFDCTGDPATGCAVSVEESTGFSAFGVTAVVQSTQATGSAGTTPLVLYDVNCDENNATVLACHNSANPAALSPPNFWSELFDGGHASPARGLETIRRNNTFGSDTVTWAATSATLWGIVGVELNPAAASGTTVNAEYAAVTVALDAAGSVAGSGSTAFAEVATVNGTVEWSSTGDSTSLQLTADAPIEVSATIGDETIQTVSAVSSAPLTIEWLPGIPPGATTGTWVDITEYVHAGDIQRGRTYELERFAAGTCQLNLRTTTRLFDPEYTSGTYYGNLIPMAQIRIVTSWAGIAYPLFYGYVMDWGQTVEASDSMFETDIVARDAFAWFEQMGLPGSWLDAAVRVSPPDRWWRMNETAGTVAIESGSFGGLDGRYENDPELGGDPVVPFSGGDGAPTFDPAFTQHVVVPLGEVFALPVDDFTLEVWFTHPDETIVNPEYLVCIGNTNGTETSLRLYGDGWVAGSSSTGFVSDASVIVTDDLPHQAVLVREDATLTLYVDGGPRNTGACSLIALPSDVFRIGLGPDNNIGSGLGAADTAFNGQIGHVMLWEDRALSAAEVAEHWNAGGLGYAGFDTGAVLDALLTFKGWPSGLRDIGVGASTVGGYELPDNMLEMVQRLADTEAGQTYMDGAGNVVHRPRSALWAEPRSNTSQATYGDVHSGEALVYVAEGFALHRDEAQIRNPVTAERSGGVSFTVEDVTYSTGRYGERAWSAPATYDDSDVVMVSRAWALLTRYKDLGTRLRAMRLTPHRDPDNLWPEAWGREIGDRITIQRRPLGTGNTIQVDQILEGVTYSFGDHLSSWVTEFRGSPVDDTPYAKFDECVFDEVVFAY